VEGKGNFLWRLNCVGSPFAVIPQISIAPWRRRSDLLCVSLRPRRERVRRRAVNNLPKENIHYTMATMDPLMTPLGQMLLEEITPVVMLISTPSVEEASLKNGLSFLQMLRPFCSFDNIDGNLALRIQSFLIHYPLCLITPHRHCTSSCSACQDCQWPTLSPSQVQIALVLRLRCEEARFEGN